jgi:precorrin-6A/cobalt-precorrin-6A reductase
VCHDPSVARRILILGGTGEARALARTLDDEGVGVVTSLAGRVAHPRRPAGELRVGGFGGADGLERWLAQRQGDVAAVVDATHPFAARISASAATACARAGVALLALRRPGWSAQAGDRWHWVDDLPQAAGAIATLGRRVLLTTGRGDLAPFAAVSGAWFLVRSIDAPDPPLAPRHEVLLDRGPFTLEGELALIDRHAIDIVVTKDSGGEAGRPKLLAARRRGLPVVVVRRPPPPAVGAVSSVAEAVGWARAHADP